MNAFGRGKRGIQSIYVPTRTGMPIQRSTSTADLKTVRAMKRMVVELRDSHRWSLLEAVRTNKVTLSKLYIYHASNQLATLEAELSAKNLSDYLAGWTSWVKANRREGIGTGERYAQQVTTLIAPDATFLVSDLTKAAVVKWLAGMTSSSSTRRHYLYALKSFIRYLLDVGVLESDPIAGLKAPKKHAPRERWVTSDIDQKIIAAASPKYQAAFAFIKSTGCDVGSAWRAQLGDLDLAHGLVNLRGTKTDHRKVHGAEIEPWAVSILRTHVKGLVGASTPLFPGRTNNGANHHHARCCTAVGVSDYWLKDSRHSVAVRMRLAGRSFEEIAAQLGTSVYQAVTTYTKYRPTTTDSTTRIETGGGR